MINKIKICIVKLSAMGDIVHAMVALEFIKKYLPNSEIDWVVESGFSGVIENNPHIDNILKVNLKDIKKDKKNIFKQIKLVRKYSKKKYDIIIDAQGLMKSALVARFIGAKVIAGFSKDSIREGIASYFYTQKVNIDYDRNTIDRNVRVLCEPLGIEVSSEDIIGKKPFLYAQSPTNSAILKVPISLDEEYNLFVIGSTWESRNYPKEKFVEIADSLKILTYIVWGSEEEYEKASWMQEQSEYIKILPRGNLNLLKSCISNCRLLIGNDTGPTHMAWGLNVASITIFGPTPTNRVYVTPINKVVKSSSKIDHYKLDKNDFSICEIEVQEIVDIANVLLK